MAFGILKKGSFLATFSPTKPKKCVASGTSAKGCLKRWKIPVISPDVNRKIRVADLITGYGVSESVRHFYDLHGGDVSGKKVVVQGWGNVGAAAALYLAQAGAQIVGIIDRAGGLIRPEGLSYDEVKGLFLAKEGNALKAEGLQPFDEVNAAIWDLPADVFLPCAASRLVTRDQVERMAKAGVQVISSGANVPFADKEIFYGPIAEFADERWRSSRISSPIVAWRGCSHI